MSRIKDKETAEYIIGNVLESLIESVEDGDIVTEAIFEFISERADVSVMEQLCINHMRESE